MDLLAACRVFVSVGERGSFTLGAAAARVPQPVASRRIAALEAHFGERLFDRSTRRAALTPFGRDMLPPARRLIQLAEALEYHAEQARLRPLSLAVPETCPVRALAELSAAAHEQGVMLEFRPAGPAERAELVATAQVRVALVAVPPAGADWTVPLGVAAPRARAGGAGGAVPPAGADGTVPLGVAATGAGTPGPLRVESLRPGRRPQPVR